MTTQPDKASLIPTPLTDAAEFEIEEEGHHQGEKVVPSSLARRMERSLVDPEGSRATAVQMIATLRNYYYAQKQWDERTEDMDAEEVARRARVLTKYRELVEEMEATIKEIREGGLNPNVDLPPAEGRH